MQRTCTTRLVSRIVTIACTIAGCAPVHAELPPPEGPPLSSVAEWIATINHDDDPPQNKELAAFRAELAGVCRGTQEGDKHRVLSPGAIQIGETPTRGCRLGSLSEEIALFEKLLRATPKDHPDYIRIIDRMAETAFLLEYLTFRECVDLMAVRPIDNRQLDGLRSVISTIRTNAELANRVTRGACNILARSPAERLHAPCAFRFPPAPPPPPPVCSEEPMSVPKNPPGAYTCEAPAR
jgi:hypothetical protein